MYNVLYDEMEHYCEDGASQIIINALFRRCLPEIRQEYRAEDGPS